MKKLLLCFLLPLLVACDKIDETNYISFKAGFKAPQVVRVGEKITFEPNETTTGAQSFLWKFGDNKKQTSTEKTPIFAYDTIGEYTSSFLVEMNKKNGLQKDSAKQKIFVLPTTHDPSSGLYTQTELKDEDGEAIGIGVDDVAMSFAPTTAGGFYVVAQTNLNSILVAKVKANLSDTDWIFGIDDLGASPIYPKSIIQTSDRGCLITGYIEANIGDSDAFVLKLDENGIEEWRNTETNSSNYERYNDSIEISNEQYLLAGSIGKNPSSAVAVLHLIDANGDYTNKVEYSNFKNYHVSQLKKYGHYPALSFVQTLVLLRCTPFQNSVCIAW